MKLKPEDIKLIAESLCCYDRRNPYHDITIDDDDDYVKDDTKDCMCDNCFYGRTRLAVLLIIACKLELPNTKYKGVT